MSYSFDPTEKIIVVRAELRGSGGATVVWLVLDTGSTRTLIRSDILASLGYDLSTATQFAQVTTVSGASSVPLINLSSIAALGRKLSAIAVVAHQFPHGFP